MLIFFLVSHALQFRPTWRHPSCTFHPKTSACFFDCSVVHKRIGKILIFKQIILVIRYQEFSETYSLSATHNPILYKIYLSILCYIFPDVCFCLDLFNLKTKSSERLLELATFSMSDHSKCISLKVPKEIAANYADHGPQSGKYFETICLMNWRPGSIVIF